jgi:acyl-coenzyme A synthetase/AMP-(fatty) acid ligase
MNLLEVPAILSRRGIDGDHRGREEIVARANSPVEVRTRIAGREDEKALFGIDGRLSLRGRASDVINVLGDKIAAGPIEYALQDRLGAEGVCVMSMTSTDASDEIIVVIQPGRPLEPAAIQVAVNAELGMVKRIPVRAVLIEKLPRNAMGKVERLVLKRQLALASEGRLSGR